MTTFNIFGIVAGNSDLCIKPRIYGIGNNGFHPNNSVDELLFVGEELVAERTGQDWGWGESDGIKFEGTLDEAQSIARALPDDKTKTFHLPSEWEEYLRTLASNSSDLKASLEYCHQSGCYFFPGTPIQSGIAMKVETKKVTALIGFRPRTFYHSFEW